MKYIITEKQLEVIEIGTARGMFLTNPSIDFWFTVSGILKKKDKIEAFQNYFSKKFGIGKKDFGDNSILGYYNFLTQSKHFDDDTFDVKFSDEEVALGFAYYVAKKYFGLKKGTNIEFFKTKEKKYYFFDPEIKSFVGLIDTRPSDAQYLPKKTRQVKESAVMKSLIGKGYGTKMYLTVVRDVEYLQSDTYLYSGSLRMWRDVLPKYVNVWAAVERGLDTKFIEQKPNKRLKNSDIGSFIASIYHSNIS